jgi:hypothetical protein
MEYPKMAKVVIYQEDGSYIEREPTEAEIQQEAKDYAEWLEQKEAQEEIKQKKLELLQRLGISEDEIKILLS